MRKYWRILRLFWLTSLAAEMEYRLNFVIATLASLGSLGGSIFGLWLFYRQGYRLGGWTWDEALLVLGIFTFLEGLTAALLTPNLGRLIRHIQSGTLDFVLLKPVDSQFWISAREFSPWGLPDLALGLMILGYAGVRLGLAPWQYLAGVLPIILAAIVLYSLWFMLSTTGIWFVKIYNVTEVLRSMLEAGRFPISAYPAAYRFFFTFLVPVAFLTTVPARLILNRADGRWLLAAALVASGLWFIARRFWRFALRFYTSASS